MIALWLLPLLLFCLGVLALAVMLLRDEQRLKRDRLRWEAAALQAVAGRCAPPAPVVSARVKVRPALPPAVATLAVYGAPKPIAPPPIRPVYVDHLAFLGQPIARGRAMLPGLAARARNWQPVALADEPVSDLYVERSVLAGLVRSGFDDRELAVV